MKIIYIECDAEELKANRGIMDSVIDLFGNISRSIFGNGAVSAAKFLAGKAPGMYDMSDVIKASL